MGTTFRHFAALTKKNFIGWKRQPCSSLAQLLLPGLLMLIVVFLRTKIHPTTVDGSVLLDLKHPTYVLQTRDGKISPLQTSQTFEEFFLYSNYTDVFSVGYNPIYDFASPLYFYPTNCAQSNSFMLPQVASPGIAVIGAGNKIQNATIDYLQGLWEWQHRRDYRPLDYEFLYFDTVEEFREYVAAPNYILETTGICFGFQVQERAENDYLLSLHFDDQTWLGGLPAVGIPNQANPAYDNGDNTPKINDYKMYQQDGYSFLQNLVANLVLRAHTGDDEANIAMMNVPFPSPTLERDPFIQIDWNFVPGFLFLIYILPVYNMVFLIVKEKESRTKESMRMMGMSDVPYWLSWFVYYTIVSTITATIAWAILSINCIQSGKKLYIWYWFVLYGESIFGEIILIQSLFSKSKFAGIVASIIYFCGAFLDFPIIGSNGTYTLKSILSLLPQVDVWQIAIQFGHYESSGLGIDADTASTITYNFSFDQGLRCFIYGFFLWGALGLYLDQVLPSEYGQRKHPCFMFMPSTYRGCCGKRQVLEEDGPSSHLIAENDNLESNALKADAYEPAPPEVTRLEGDGRYLRIEDLQKTYDNGFKAVKGLNIKMYQNQIFALLGQNGAGKSTTISMLTGLIAPSKGKASCFDKDMFNDIDSVRQFMGVCPQHDVLFDLLTPIEHLNIFYDFKGGDPKEKQREIADLIRDVGLTADQNKPAGSLSGGNKRKLSVAIAVCGGSKLVLLDEPTAGMDLSARRAMWDMLKNYRRDKIIILTTHYMDEADVLGDRIGIMAHGELMCMGSSLFLKKRFGAGYKLTMVKKVKAKNKLVEPYLKSKLANVQMLSEVSSEIQFGILNEEAAKFKQFFVDFDKDHHELGIESYGISITTLEEVFLNINKEFGIDGAALAEREMQNELGNDMRASGASESDPYSPMASPTGMREKKLNTGMNNTTMSSNSSSRFTTLFGSELDTEAASMERLINDSTFTSNVAALLAKRFHIYKRDRSSLVCEVFIPFVMVLLGCSVTLINFFQNNPAALISVDDFPIPDHILMNSQTVKTGDNTIQPATFATYLPSPDDWTVKYTPTEDFDEFYNEIWDNRSGTIPYKYGSYQIYEADNSKHQYYINTFFNLTSQDATAAYPQYMYESVLKAASGDSKFTFQTETVPFPTLQVFKDRSEAGNAVDFVFMVSIGIAMIPTVMVSFILKEREMSLKHMQLVSGMSLPAYWISNYIADIVKTYIPLILIYCLSIIFKCNFPGVVYLMMLLPWALVPFTYVTSFLFKSETSAQVITLFFHFMVGGILGPLSFFLQTLPPTFVIGDKMRWWLCICPTWCVVQSILWSDSGEVITTERQTNPDKYPQISTELWALQNLGGDALMLGLHFVVDTLILAIIEWDIFSACRKYTCRKIPSRKSAEELNLDQDVLAEEERVTMTKDEVIRVADFRKAYTTLFGAPFLAVERISFGLDYGECFALLGVNGAGKSSTFKSLTADTAPTEGQITIEGLNTEKQFAEARKLIGYCPQKDAIFPLMSVEEHLYFYAKLKGIPADKHKDCVERAILELSLSDQRKKLAGNLSGGNKRKLSVAMATLGNPPIILLDEPSAGMDPEARRFMWSVVAKISQRDKKSAVILTTHSMEEAEALSTKMGIMVRGGIFKCFGSSQHIKNKFGTGYEIEIKIRKPLYSELEQLAVKYGIKASLTERVVLQDMYQLLAGSVDKIVLGQITVDGLGSDLAIEAESSNGTVSVRNLVTYLFVQVHGLAALDLLARHFEQVDLIEQCSDFFKMRVPREEKTIGWLFGTIEDEKARCEISEYSVSQTTLEQIFQNFANQSINAQFCLTFKLGSNGQIALLNPDRKTNFSLLSKGSMAGSRPSLLERQAATGF